MPIDTTIQQSDFTNRLISLLPVNWFSTEDLSSGGVTNSIIDSFASNDMKNYSNLELIQASFSLLTATGNQIDLIAKDYFGSSFPRNLNETDGSYAKRIVTKLFMPIGTISAVKTGIQRALGSIPQILEGQDIAQLGGYSDGITAYGPLEWYDGYVPTGSIGWLGGTFAYQALITVIQAAQDSPYFLSYLDIMSLIDSLRPLATIFWVQVLGQDGHEPVGWTH